MKSLSIKEYQVQAVLKNLISIPIKAISLDEAVNKAKELKESDFIEILGDNIDESFRISGVYETYPKVD